MRDAINVASVPRVVVVTIVVCVDTVWERPAGSVERDKTLDVVVCCGVVTCYIRNKKRRPRK